MRVSAKLAGFRSSRNTEFWNWRGFTSSWVAIPGIDYVGPLPAEVQRVTVFSAGIAASSKQREAARALIAFLTSPSVTAAVVKSGLEVLKSQP